MRWGWVSLILWLVAPPVWAYRPFESTDAAVTDAHEAEVEVGMFTWERSKHDNTLVIPRMVLNYGLTNQLEGVAEFSVERPPHDSLQLTGSALSLKALAKDGVLQHQAGPSLALEAGILLPSTRAGERHTGFEGLAVLSKQVAPVTVHVNVGGGLDRASTNPFVLWGVIGELPVHPTLKLVGEVNGESGRQQTAEASGLVGLIWQSPWPNVLVDTGIRRGFTIRADDWQVTVGCTISWPLAHPQRTHAARSGLRPRA